MNETTNEVMETTEETMVTETPMEADFNDTVESEGGSGKAGALVLGGVGLASAAGAAFVKKRKDKKDGKPKKKRAHYKIVKVEDPVDEDADENTVDSEAEVVDETETTEE